jgi:hypothetical protein
MDIERNAMKKFPLVIFAALGLPVVVPTKPRLIRTFPSESAGRLIATRMPITETDRTGITIITIDTMRIIIIGAARMTMMMMRYP